MKQILLIIAMGIALTSCTQPKVYHLRSVEGYNYDLDLNGDERTLNAIMGEITTVSYYKLGDTIRIIHTDYSSSKYVISSVDNL